MPPPPDELLSLFPPPHELGGALNPILLRMPDDFSTTQQGFPPLPPPFLDNGSQKQPRLHQPPPRRRQPVINARLGEEYQAAETTPENHVVADLDADSSDISVTVGAKINTVKTEEDTSPASLWNKPKNAAASPFLKKPPAQREQVPFIGQPQEVLPPPLENLRDYQTSFESEPVVPVPQDVVPIAAPSQMVSLPKQVYFYKMKLKDKNFHANLTKAHVYHFEGPPHDEVEDEYFDGREAYLAQAIQPPISYLQDSNPFNFRPPVAQKQSAHQEPLRNELPLEEINTTTTPPPLDKFAPAARPVRKETKISKPDFDLVYRPDQRITSRPRPTTTTTASTTTTTTTTTPASENVFEDATAESPIAEHISSLLREYLTTPRAEGDEAPSIYMTENSLVMEYLSPEGKRQTVVPSTDDGVHFEEVTQRSEFAQDSTTEPTIDKHDDESSVEDEGNDDFIPSTPDRFYVAALEDLVGPEDQKQVGQQQQQQQQVYLPPELENLVLPKLEEDFLKELVENNNLILPQYGKEYQVKIKNIYTYLEATDYTFSAI